MELESASKLAENVKHLNKSLGVRSKHRQSIANAITEGLPAKFCAASLGFSSSYVRQSRKRGRENPTPALLTESRTEGKGRTTTNDALTTENVKFFNTRSSIWSGSKTYTRKLTMPKERVEVELYAEQPAILRRAVKNDPSLLSDIVPNKHLTRRQMDMLAAEHAAQQDGFSEAQEYKSRLETEFSFS